MGTWGVGPFDNDCAADFAGHLDDAAEEDRPAMIWAALEAAVGDGGTPRHCGDAAIAAAALVAAQCPDGEPTDPVYGPEEPLPVLGEDFRVTALEAAARVMGPDSDVADLWAEGVAGAEWFEMVRGLRRVLAAALDDPDQLALPIDT